MVRLAGFSAINNAEQQAANQRNAETLEAQEARLQLLEEPLLAGDKVNCSQSLKNLRILIIKNLAPLLDDSPQDQCALYGEAARTVPPLVTAQTLDPWHPEALAFLAAAQKLLHRPLLSNGNLIPPNSTSLSSLAHPHPMDYALWEPADGNLGHGQNPLEASLSCIPTAKRLCLRTDVPPPSTASTSSSSSSPGCLNLADELVVGIDTSPISLQLHGEGNAVGSDPHRRAHQPSLLLQLLQQLNQCLGDGSCSLPWAPPTQPRGRKATPSKMMHDMAHRTLLGRPVTVQILANALDEDSRKVASLKLAPEALASSYSKPASADNAIQSLVSTKTPDTEQDGMLTEDAPEVKRGVAPAASEKDLGEKGLGEKELVGGDVDMLPASPEAANGGSDKENAGENDRSAPKPKPRQAEPSQAKLNVPSRGMKEQDLPGGDELSKASKNQQRSAPIVRNRAIALDKAVVPAITATGSPPATVPHPLPRELAALQIDSTRPHPLPREVAALQSGTAKVESAAAAVPDAGGGKKEEEAATVRGLFTLMRKCLPGTSQLTPSKAERVAGVAGDGERTPGCGVGGGSPDAAGDLTTRAGSTGPGSAVNEVKEAQAEDGTPAGAATGAVAVAKGRAGESVVRAMMFGGGLGKGGFTAAEDAATQQLPQPAAQAPPLPGQAGATATLTHSEEVAVQQLHQPSTPTPVHPSHIPSSLQPAITHSSPPSGPPLAEGGASDKGGALPHQDPGVQALLERSSKVTLGMNEFAAELLELSLALPTGTLSEQSELVLPLLELEIHISRWLGSSGLSPLSWMRALELHTGAVVKLKSTHSFQQSKGLGPLGSVGKPPQVSRLSTSKVHASPSLAVHHPALQYSKHMGACRRLQGGLHSYLLLHRADEGRAAGHQADIGRAGVDRGGGNQAALEQGGDNQAVMTDAIPSGPPGESSYEAMAVDMEEDAEGGADGGDECKLMSEHGGDLQHLRLWARLFWVRGQLAEAEDEVLEALSMFRKCASALEAIQQVSGSLATTPADAGVGAAPQLKPEPGPELTLSSVKSQLDRLEVYHLVDAAAADLELKRYDRVLSQLGPIAFSAQEGEGDPPASAGDAGTPPDRSTHTGEAGTTTARPTEPSSAALNVPRPVRKKALQYLSTAAEATKQYGLLVSCHAVLLSHEIDRLLHWDCPPSPSTGDLSFVGASAAARYLEAINPLTAFLKAVRKLLDHPQATAHPGSTGSGGAQGASDHGASPSFLAGCLTPAAPGSPPKPHPHQKPHPHPHYQQRKPTRSGSAHKIRTGCPSRKHGGLSRTGTRRAPAPAAGHAPRAQRRTNAGSRSRSGSRTPQRPATIARTVIPILIFTLTPTLLLLLLLLLTSIPTSLFAESPPSIPSPPHTFHLLMLHQQLLDFLLGLHEATRGFLTDDSSNANSRLSTKSSIERKSLAAMIEVALTLLALQHLSVETGMQLLGSRIKSAADLQPFLDVCYIRLLTAANAAAAQLPDGRLPRLGARKGRKAVPAGTLAAPATSAPPSGLTTLVRRLHRALAQVVYHISGVRLDWRDESFGAPAPDSGMSWVVEPHREEINSWESTLDTWRLLAPLMESMVKLKGMLERMVKHTLPPPTEAVDLGGIRSFLTDPSIKEFDLLHGRGTLPEGLLLASNTAGTIGSKALVAFLRPQGDKPQLLAQATSPPNAHTPQPAGPATSPPSAHEPQPPALPPRPPQAIELSFGGHEIEPALVDALQQRRTQVAQVLAAAGWKSPQQYVAVHADLYHLLTEAVHPMDPIRSSLWPGTDEKVAEEVEAQALIIQFLLDSGATELSPSQWVARPGLQQRVKQYRSYGIRAAIACCSLEDETEEVGHRLSDLAGMLYESSLNAIPLTDGGCKRLPGGCGISSEWGLCCCSNVEEKRQRRLLLQTSYHLYTKAASILSSEWTIPFYMGKIAAKLKGVVDLDFQSVVARVRYGLDAQGQAEAAGGLRDHVVVRSNGGSSEAGGVSGADAGARETGQGVDGGGEAVRMKVDVSISHAAGCGQQTARPDRRMEVDPATGPVTASDQLPGRADARTEVVPTSGPATASEQLPARADVCTEVDLTDDPSGSDQQPARADMCTEVALTGDASGSERPPARAMDVKTSDEIGQSQEGWRESCIDLGQSQDLSWRESCLELYALASRLSTSSNLGRREGLIDPIYRLHSTRLKWLLMACAPHRASPVGALREGMECGVEATHSGRTASALLDTSGPNVSKAAAAPEASSKLPRASGGQDECQHGQQVDSSAPGDKLGQAGQVAAENQQDAQEQQILKDRQLSDAARPAPLPLLRFLASFCFLPESAQLAAAVQAGSTPYPEQAAALQAAILHDCLNAMRWCLDKYRPQGQYHPARFQLARASLLLGNSQDAFADLAVLFSPAGRTSRLFGISVVQLCRKGFEWLQKKRQRQQQMPTLAAGQMGGEARGGGDDEH
eukprot:gene27253-2507_t